MRWEYQTSIVSGAPPQAVWDVLLDGRRWSFWNPDIEWLWLEGDPTPGTVATIKFRRVRQTALVIDEIVPPQRFALRLTVGPIARCQLSWTLTVQPPGTRIDAVVAITGIAAGPLLKRAAQRVADALPGHLERLAQRALDHQSVAP
jgi:hypothetical protein